MNEGALPITCGRVSRYDGFSKVITDSFIPAFASGLGRHRILIVEDHPAVRQVVLAGLERAGFACTVVTDVQTAIQMLSLATEPFDLLLTDHELPGASGVELVAQLRAGSWKCRVIVFSGSLPLRVMEQYEALKVDRIIEKPCSISALVVQVWEVLNEQRETGQPGCLP